MIGKCTCGETLSVSLLQHLRHINGGTVVHLHSRCGARTGSVNISRVRRFEGAVCRLASEVRDGAWVMALGRRQIGSRS